MKALRSPSNSGSDTGREVGPAAALSLLILLVLALPAALRAASVPAAAEEPKLAVWKVKEVSFAYRSSVAIYSCRALQERIVSILRAVGARDDLEVTLNGCDTFTASPSVDIPSVDMPTQQARTAFPAPSDRLLNRPTNRGQLASVRIRLMMPTEVTPEVIDELERDKSRRELVSRVTGDPTARQNVPVVFAAQWQSVTLSHKTIGLDPEECELMEQMTNSVLRPLGVRVVRKSHSCDRDRISHIPPQLTAEVLIGVPFDTGPVFKMPPEGASDPAPDPASSPPSEAAPPEPGTAKPPQ